MRTRIVLLTVALAVSGCAQPPQRKSADIAAMTKLRRIAVVDPGPAPVKYLSQSAGPGVAAAMLSAIPGLGVLGAAIVGGVGSAVGGAANAATEGNASKGKLPPEVVAEQSRALSEQLVSLLQDGLQRGGHEVLVVASRATKDAAQKNDTVDCARYTTDADALLQLSYITVGYTSPPYKTEWVPSLYIRARLTDCHTGLDVYRNAIVASNRNSQFASGELIQVPEAPPYPSIDALASNVEESFNELAKRQQIVGQRIIRQLLAGPDSIPTLSGAAVTTAALKPVSAQPTSGSTVPYLAQKGQERFQDFLTRPFPRAFAISDTGYSVATWGARPLDPTKPVDTKDRALQICREAAGKECVLYMVDDTLLYRK